MHRNERHPPKFLIFKLNKTKFTPCFAPGLHPWHIYLHFLLFQKACSALCFGPVRRFASTTHTFQTSHVCSIALLTLCFKCPASLLNWQVSTKSQTSLSGAFLKVLGPPREWAQPLDSRVLCQGAEHSDASVLRYSWHHMAELLVELDKRCTSSGVADVFSRSGLTRC